ncbi:hypothetical protein NMY22_g19675 [Coprinellus aureogranulatus]|nr:hypothetical protein NMY22_g19675 [Coprinellus aureogranulatus]
MKGRHLATEVYVPNGWDIGNEVAAVLHEEWTRGSNGELRPEASLGVADFLPGCGYEGYGDKASRSAPSGVSVRGDAGLAALASWKGKQHEHEKTVDQALNQDIELTTLLNPDLGIYLDMTPIPLRLFRRTRDSSGH